MSRPEPRPTILLVDDEPDIRLVARLTLEQLGGFRVIEAASGVEALDFARRARPDLIILDVMMPSMDGPEVLSALREDPDTSGVPVVFLTAKAMPSELERLRALGVRDIITKPFDPATLPRLIRGVLAGATPSAALPPSPPAAAAAASEVDPTALGRLEGLTTESGRDLSAELVELFAISAGEAAPRLRALAAEGAAGAREAERIAHSLKSSAATVGATTIAALARDIETLSRDGRPSEIPPLADRLSAALPDTLSQLRAAAPPGHPPA